MGSSSLNEIQELKNEFLSLENPSLLAFELSKLLKSVATKPKLQEFLKMSIICYETKNGVEERIDFNYYYLRKFLNGSEIEVVGEFIKVLIPTDDLNYINIFVEGICLAEFSLKVFKIKEFE